MTARIDAHQHIWQLQRGDYGWLTSQLGVLYRDYDFSDLLPHLQRAEIDGTILVQAAPTRAETEFMLRAADAEPRIRGVVGWVDFESPQASEALAELAERPKLRGVRPMIQDIEDPDWMLREALAPSFGAAAEAGLVFDALVLPHHLQNLLEVCERHPDLQVVIDHAAKPDIRNWNATSRARIAWAEDMSRLAQETRCACKLSGLVTEASPDWTPENLAPFIRVLLEQFGPDRLLFGSDWPVVNLAGGYSRWWDAVRELTQELSDPERDAVFGLNAIRVYGLEDPPSTPSPGQDP